MSAIGTPTPPAAARPSTGSQAATAGAAAGTGDPADAFAALLQDLLPAEPGAPDGGAGAEIPADGGGDALQPAPLEPGAGLQAGWPPGLLPAPSLGVAAADAPSAGGGAARLHRGPAGPHPAAAAAELLRLDAGELPAAAPAAPAAVRGFENLLDAMPPATASQEALCPTADVTGLLPPAATPPPPPVPFGTPAAAVHQASLPSHPLEPSFAGELGAEVRWMVEAAQQQAELHLNPAELGPIRIQLTLQGQGADISLAAAHATTRDVLQQSLPALREMLAGHGLQLGQATVSDGGRQFARRDSPPEDPARDAAPAPIDAAPVRAGTMTLRTGHGMLDLYA